MSCYNPLIGIFNGQYSDNGKKLYHINAGIKNYEKDDVLGYFDDVILIPCGNCAGCRIDKSRTWADRMCLEYDHTKKAVFVTLTYEDKFLPYSASGYPTLVKSDLQTFMKDLRGNKFYDGKEIRFYGSGEYGEKPCFGFGDFWYGRPHYHVILFGLGLSDFTEAGYIGEFQFPDFYSGNYDHKLYYDGQNELHQPHYRSPHLDNVVWKKGRCCVAEFSWETAAYTARYVRKKLNGSLSHNYTDLGIIAPFALMSRRPGIAGYFMEDHPEKDFFEETGFSVNGKIKRIPNYLFDKLDSIDHKAYSDIKESRRKFAKDSLFLELQNTDLSLSEYYENKRIDFENRTKILRQRIE